MKHVQEIITTTEFATYRGDYDVALEKYQHYMEEGDSYVAERMTRLAMHEEMYPDMMDAANAMLMWQQ